MKPYKHEPWVDSFHFYVGLFLAAIWGGFASLICWYFGISLYWALGFAALVDVTYVLLMQGIINNKRMYCEDDDEA